VGIDGGAGVGSKAWSSTSAGLKGGGTGGISLTDDATTVQPYPLLASSNSINLAKFLTGLMYSSGAGNSGIFLSTVNPGGAPTEDDIRSSFGHGTSLGSGGTFDRLSPPSS